MEFDKDYPGWSDNDYRLLFHTIKDIFVPTDWVVLTYDTISTHHTSFHRPEFLGPSRPRRKLLMPSPVEMGMVQNL
jgi:hypothetical protein